jgi:hypothetical protein
MNGLTREEVAAQQASTEARVEVKLTSLEKKVDVGFANVDTRFANVDAGFASVDANFARVRADMEKLKADLVQWMVGLTIAASATAITVMTFVLNHAVPKAPVQQAAAAPIVIYLPPVQAAPVALPAPAKPSP